MCDPCQPFFMKTVRFAIAINLAIAVHLCHRANVFNLCGMFLLYETWARNECASPIAEKAHTRKPSVS